MFFFHSVMNINRAKSSWWIILGVEGEDTALVASHEQDGGQVLAHDLQPAHVAVGWCRVQWHRDCPGEGQGGRRKNSVLSIICGYTIGYDYNNNDDDIPDSTGLLT